MALPSLPVAAWTLECRRLWRCGHRWTTSPSERVARRSTRPASQLALHSALELNGRADDGPQSMYRGTASTHASCDSRETVTMLCHPPVPAKPGRVRIARHCSAPCAEPVPGKHKNKIGSPASAGCSYFPPCANESHPRPARAHPSALKSWPSATSSALPHRPLFVTVEKLSPRRAKTTRSPVNVGVEV